HAPRHGEGGGRRAGRGAAREVRRRPGQWEAGSEPGHPRLTAVALVSGPLLPIDVSVTLSLATARRVPVVMADGSRRVDVIAAARRAVHMVVATADAVGRAARPVAG